MIKQFLQGVINQVRTQADLSRGKPLSAEPLSVAFDPNQGQPDRSGGQDEVLPLSPSETIAEAPISITDSLAHRDRRVMLKRGKRGKDSLLSSKEEAEEDLREIARKNEVYAEESMLPDMYSVPDERYDAVEQLKRDYPLDAIKPSWLLIKLVQRLVTGEDGKMLPEREVKKIEAKLQDVLSEERLSEREPKQVGGPAIDEQMGALMPEEAQIPTEMPTEEGEPILPDEEMESDYMDMVISEALVPEEEQYLLDRLNEDERLSVIFDKVVETASEFSGAGSVEGPGSAVSDSIPARLSDGEFVMTSKATNQIGPDTLEELMSLAEDEADGGRQAIAIGGLAKAEGSAILAGASEDERSIALKNKEAMRLLDPRLSLFAS